MVVDVAEAPLRAETGGRAVTALFRGGDDSTDEGAEEVEAVVLSLVTESRSLSGDDVVLALVECAWSAPSQS